MSTSPDTPGVSFALVRRWFDALLMAIAGLFGLFGAGSTDHPVLVFLVGIAAILYAGWIALSGGGYSMPLVLYLIPVGGIAWLLWS